MNWGTYLFPIFPVLVLRQAWVLNQAGEFLELLKARLKSVLAKLPKGQLLSIVTNLLQNRVEVVLAVGGYMSVTQWKDRKMG